MNKKIEQIIAIFLIELIILLPVAIADTLNITNIRVEDVAQTSAKIKWKTNNNAEGSLNYGQTSSLGQTRTSQNFVKDHSFLLSSLIEDTQYYFQVSSNDGTTQITDSNNDNFYTFSTLPLTPLFINASIPSTYNAGRTIDIIGKSIRFAKVDLYTNNDPVRTLNADND